MMFKLNLYTNHDAADSNDLRELEDKTNLKPPSNLMSLMEVYREAILNGDDKTVSDIEAKISIVEKEKNELVQKVSDYPLSFLPCSSRNQQICIISIDIKSNTYTYQRAENDYACTQDDVRDDGTFTSNAKQQMLYE
ncbi:uncharacterized protein Fot_04779 [Forsythia ovata]|uniref:Uncharacterized protein n=1 Tax=Forsythia ovata TaxID=205694 RepID=A0ABD1XDJ1_9LAMI